MTIIDLAHALPDPPTGAYMRERMPDLAARMTEAQLDAMDADPRFRVLATRRAARALVAARPDAPPDVVLDAGGVEVATSPFLSELLDAWPRATIVNANEDVRDTWDLVIERRNGSPASGGQRP